MSSQYNQRNLLVVGVCVTVGFFFLMLMFIAVAGFGNSAQVAKVNACTALAKSQRLACLDPPAPKLTLAQQNVKTCNNAANNWENNGNAGNFSWGTRMKDLSRKDG
jgi:hypothetical protein